MDICQLRSNLVNLLHEFLLGNVEAKALYDFTWEVIDSFSPKVKGLPTEMDFEPEFWYAIWQIQHLAGETSDAMLRAQTPTTLDYLEGHQSLPKELAGRRP